MTLKELSDTLLKDNKQKVIEPITVEMLHDLFNTNKKVIHPQFGELSVWNYKHKELK